MVDLTTVGSSTWVATFTGDALILCYGGGGGGAGGTSFAYGGGGGGAGALSFSLISVVSGNSYAYTIGGGGAGGAHGGAGSDGSPTIWGTVGSPIIRAAGGKKGLVNAGGLGGAEADCIGLTKLPGGPGSRGPANTYNGGDGGDAPGAEGGKGGKDPGQGVGITGTAPGGGGSGGGSSNAGVGGAGGRGQIIIIQAPTTEVGFVRVPDVGLTDTAGSYGWTAPADGIIIVECYGGGGGGRGGTALGNGGAGGGGGAYAKKAIAVTKGQAYTRVVGAAGNGGAYGGNGTDGADSKFYLNSAPSTSLVLAAGGKKATGSTSGAGQGGKAVDSIGDTKADGLNGVTGTSSTQTGGAGGRAALPNGGLGGAGGGGGTGANAGQPGLVPGGAGGGGCAANSGANPGTGGAGAQGAVFISYYLTFGSVIVNHVEHYIRRVTYKEPTGSTTHVIGADGLSRVVGGTTKVPMAKVRPDLTAGVRNPPEYLPTGNTPATYGGVATPRNGGVPYSSVYNTARGLFNWSTPNLDAAIAANNADIVIIGDSLSEGWTHLGTAAEGFNITADFPHAWPRMMRDYIAQQKGIPVGGTGVVRPTSVSSQQDPEWTGNWGEAGGHYINTSDTTKVATFTSNLPGTAVAILTVGAGQAEVTIDGTVVGATTVGAFNTVVRTVFSGLADTTHTVKLRGLGGDVYCVGASVYRPNAGIKVHVMSQGGSTASIRPGDTTDQDAWADTSGLIPARMLPTYSQQPAMFGRRPDAVIIALGGNDLRFVADSGPDAGGPPYTAIKAAHKLIGETFAHASTDIILCPDPHGSSAFIANPYNTARPTWVNLLDLALEKGWSFLDFEFLTGGYEGLAGRSDASGTKFTGDSFGHLSAAGAKYVGELFGSVILG